MSKRLPAGMRAYLQTIGQKGGRIGGKRALETMTPEARRARASHAGRVAAAVRQAKAKVKE
jgi:hypothetical protein